MHSIKKILLPALVLPLVFVSCSKSDTIDRCATVTTVAPQSEVAALQAELISKSISAVGDSRGFFYIIARQGDTTKRPTVCSTVTTSYTARLLNGTQVDAGNNVSFGLSGLILGWKEGIPLIGKGGYITLYVPPSLAYGTTGSGSIPPNTNIAFTIDLVNVQ